MVCAGRESVASLRSLLIEVSRYKVQATHFSFKCKTHVFQEVFPGRCLTLHLPLHRESQIPKSLKLNNFYKHYIESNLPSALFFGVCVSMCVVLFKNRNSHITHIPVDTTVTYHETLWVYDTTSCLERSFPVVSSSKKD